jgi:hypothetical protein
MTDTHYTGSAYIGVVGPDEIPVDSVLSIMNIERRKGDATPLFMKATKGYEARQKHVDAFLVSQHDWLLLLDHDMIFEPDTLERLRSHGVPYVSGLYMRRRFAPMFSVWFEPFTGEWPLMPFTADPERGRLHELGASGWGCVLLHREVIEGTRPYLDGYQEVLEDAMYDLRGEKDIIGSDIRYPILAKQAGFTLWGDPDVRPKHIVSYPLSPDDYSGTPESIRAEWSNYLRKQVQEARAMRQGAQ